MPIDLQVIRASDFVRLDADEQLNFEESKNVLQELARACRKRGLDHAMLDLRELPVPDKPRFTDAELAAAVIAFRDAGFSNRQRLAILYRQDVYGKLRNFTFFSRMRGLNVQAFHGFEEAMQWLWQGTENPEQGHGIEVPIFQREGTHQTAHLTDGGHRSTAPRAVRRSRRNHHR